MDLVERKENVKRVTKQQQDDCPHDFWRYLKGKDFTCEVCEKEVKINEFNAVS